MVLKALETKKNISLIFLGFLSESKCYLECALVTWCFKFKPSQPQRIILGLRETFVTLEICS